MEEVKTDEIVLSPDQQEFLDRVQDGESVFLTGRAGTGKSFVVKEAIKKLRKEGLEVAVLGTTGIAAMNIGGATMHSFFALPIKDDGVITFKDCHFVRAERREVWSTVDVILVDEVSMLRSDQMDAMEWTLNKNNCGGLADKQIIFVGDMKQLPPVVKESDNIAEVYKDEFFTSSQIYRELDISKVELKTVHRQKDPEFIEQLNNLRDGGDMGEYFDDFIVPVGSETSGTVLCPYRSTADEYNRRELNKLPGKRYVHRPEYEGEISLKSFNIPDKLVIKDGARVMNIVNINEKIVNGTTGTIHIDEKTGMMTMTCDNGEVISVNKVRFEKRDYEVNKNTSKLDMKIKGAITAYPIVLAYALTIHKSQGLTFDDLTIDLTRDCFVDGQLYVAVSRATGPEALKIVY